MFRIICSLISGSVLSSLFIYGASAVTNVLMYRKKTVQSVSFLCWIYIIMSTMKVNQRWWLKFTLDWNDSGGKRFNTSVSANVDGNVKNGGEFQPCDVDPVIVREQRSGAMERGSHWGKTPHYRHQFGQHKQDEVITFEINSYTCSGEILHIVLINEHLSQLRVSCTSPYVIGKL